MEIQDIIKARLRNQMRIHWKWLRNKENHEHVSDFLDACVNQATAWTDKEKLKQIKE